METKLNLKVEERDAHELVKGMVDKFGLVYQRTVAYDLAYEISGKGAVLRYPDAGAIINASYSGAGLRLEITHDDSSVSRIDDVYDSLRDYLGQGVNPDENLIDNSMTALIDFLLGDARRLA